MDDEPQDESNWAELGMEEQMNATNGGAVLKAIAQVTRTMATSGITKAQKNQQQGYSFRGIDDVYNTMAPVLADAKLCILPSYANRTVIERETRSGAALFYVTVEGTFKFVSAEDGSTVTVGPIPGEAMDSADKATNKAMSASLKYACLQTFMIPTHADNDADSTTHEVKGKRPEPAKAPSSEPSEEPPKKGLVATDEMIANSLTILRDASLNGNDALDKAVLALAPAIKARLLAEHGDELKAIRAAAIKVDFDAGAAKVEAKARKAA